MELYQIKNFYTAIETINSEKVTYEVGENISQAIYLIRD